MRRAPLFLLLILPCAAWAQTSAAVLTGQYNTSRTGANVQETTLTPANVSASSFGLLFTQSVDENIFAQPLYVPDLTIRGAVHNVVFAATLNNSVFAFDADQEQTALWHASLGTPYKIDLPGMPEVGILSTPVIDASLKTLFVATLTSESGALVYRLHALNLLTGAEITNVVVQGAVAGTGDNSQTTACTAASGGPVPPPCIPFQANEVLQRTALLEDTTTATIYVAFGTLSSQESTTPYHGWLIGYHFTGSAFTQRLIFASTANATQSGPACSSGAPPTNQCGHGGGIWMSGRGPALDKTGIYVVTGNGGYGGNGTGNWGESALRLNRSGVVEDFFTPYSYTGLNQYDLDLGDAGAILFTSTNANAANLMLAAGKTGQVYVLNRASLGGNTSGNSGAVQSLLATSKGCGSGPGQAKCYEIHNPAFWGRTTANPLLYVWAYGDVLRVWDFNATTNQFQADANQGTVTAANYPGGGVAVSSNGDNDGIVWGIAATTNSSNAPGQGALYAFDATNVTSQLWASTDYWFGTKFTIPTVANGKVYVPTSASPGGTTPAYLPQLRVYGLLTPADRRVAAADVHLIEATPAEMH
jgi:hypothetical protein